MSIRNKINQDKMFVSNAIVKVARSTFFRNQKHSTTFNAGKLVPVYVDSIVPGDTMDIDFNAIIRTTSPFLKAPMDDLRADFYAFFVPARLCWKYFPKMIANFADDPANWKKDLNLVVPRIDLCVDGDEASKVDSIADHMGIPPVVYNHSITPRKNFCITRLPFLAYSRIWNEWFRDENLQNAIFAPDDINSGAVDLFKNNSVDYTVSASYGGQLAPLNKIKDYFTSCLPAPQAGSEISISLGNEAPVHLNTSTAIVRGRAPIYGVDLNEGERAYNFSQVFHRYKVDNTTMQNIYTNSFSPVSQQPPTNAKQYQVVKKDGQVADHFIIGLEGVDEQHVFNLVCKPGNVTGQQLFADLDGVTGVADLSKSTGINVNDLRYLVQIQQMKETDARYGRRYKEYLLGHWGVISADARLQVPEFLGHVGFDLNINQTVQTSGTLISDTNATATTPQSNISSYSCTATAGRKICNKSFTEHGYLIIVGGVRIKHRTYAQGINKMWFRNSRFDYYDPCLANIGEQPVSNAEIYAVLNNGEENIKSVFGYQEAWADYRYLPNVVSGYQRPQIQQTLAYWNFADNYTTIPGLSSKWVEEDISSIDRCLAIPSATVPQFTADFFIKNKATRPMPVHSIPGLLDHSGKLII